MKNITTKMMAQGAVIAAVYVVLTLAFAPISFGAIQFRISEALCILPFFTVAAVPGVSYRLRSVSKWLVCVPPILANAIIIPFVLKYAYGLPDLIPYLMLTVGIGEVLAVAVLGNLLMLALEPKSSFIFGKEARAF